MMQIWFVKTYRQVLIVARHTGSCFNMLPQPKVPIVLGSAIMTIALGLISMGINENKQASVDGYASCSVSSDASINFLA